MYNKDFEHRLQNTISIAWDTLVIVKDMATWGDEASMASNLGFREGRASRTVATHVHPPARTVTGVAEISLPSLQRETPCEQLSCTPKFDKDELDADRLLAKRFRGLQENVSQQTQKNT
jgi:hypothetical protein